MTMDEISLFSEIKREKPHLFPVKNTEKSNSHSPWRIVQLQKTDQPLGLTIARSDSGTIEIVRILYGSIAAQSNLFRLNDQIVEINDRSIRHRSLEEISWYLANTRGLIKFRLLSSPFPSFRPSLHSEIFYVRALFNYDPFKDSMFPCRPLALPFQSGDILRIVDQSSQWWQAFHEDSSASTIARLIPSEEFQKKRTARSFYEFVFRLDRTINPIRRPVLLIGASNVVRHQLRSRLLQNQPNLFAIAVAHTTRPPQSNQINGVDYHFVNGDHFLAKQKCRLFIESNENEGFLYGTSMDDIRDVLHRQRKICLLNVDLHAIELFYRIDLYPYVVCLCTEQSATIDEQYRCLVDQILINNDFDLTYLRLRQLIIAMDEEKQSWIRRCYQRTD